MSEFWQDYYQDYRYLGVTLHKIEKIDTGEIYSQKHTKYNYNDNYILLRFKNIETAIQLIRKDLKNILDGKMDSFKQKGHGNLKTYSYKMVYR